MKVTEDILYIGVNDHDIDLFESQYPVPNGMAYNSYLILDDKIAVMDTVDANFTHPWLEQLEQGLNGRKPDYLIIQHMEPDHSANILEFMKHYPDTTLVGNVRTFNMLDLYFPKNDFKNRLEVKEGTELELGRHTLKFVMASMVHWPEVMMTYDKTDRVFFSADAFGKFGAMDADEPWDDEARRYYIGIVGKFGNQVQMLLKKAKALDISKICALHGPILTENLEHYISLYDTWSAYRPETEGVAVCYTSVYGHTREAAQLLAKKLEEKGITVAIHDLARAEMSEAVADAFRYDRLVLATTTYNTDMFPYMKEFLNHLTERGFRSRKIGLIENGSWGPMAAKKMTAALECAKDLTILEPVVRINAALADDSLQQLDALAAALAE